MWVLCTRYYAQGVNVSHIFVALLTTLIAYIVIVYMVGLIANRVTSNLSDYVLGGRRLSGPIAALGAGASDMSGWLLLALPGAAYTFGINQLWLPIGLSIGAYLNWQYVAKRLRVYTEIVKDSLTIPAYFDNRFHDHTRILRAATALVIVIFFTVYCSAGFYSAALLLNILFGLNYHIALLISAIVLVVYTCIGGFLAISWVDFFQGSLMFFALITVPMVTFHHLNGWHHVMHHLLLHMPSHMKAFTNISLITMISLLAWGLGYFGQPHILVRFMAVRTSKEIPVARFICMTWMVIALCGAVMTGIAGSAFYGQGLAQPDSVFLELAKSLFNPWLYAILVSAVLSAIMSTSAAQLLAASSAVSEDIFHGLLRKTHVSEKLLVLVGRIAVICIAFVAASMVLSKHNNLLWLVGFAWSGMGASFGPVIILSLYWKRMTKEGAIAGMLLAAITVIVWHNLGVHVGGIFKLYEMVPGFLVGLLGCVLGTLCFKGRPTQRMLSEFEQAKRADQLSLM